MMYLMYIDESGVVEHNAGTGHFVLCGIAIPDEEWKQNDKSINLIKSKFRINDVEVHAGWMARRYIEQEKIPDFEKLTDLEKTNRVIELRKKFLKLSAATKTRKRLREIGKQYRKTEPYLHLTQADRNECLKDIAGEISQWQNARLFAEVVNKQASSLSPEHIYESSFGQLITRFQAFLDNRSRATNQELLGMIIQDNNQTVNRKLTRLMRKFHKHGTIWRDITRIIETPLFVDSDLTSMVQVADLCAYAIRRYFDAGENELFDRIYPRFDRSRDRVVGIRHFTGAQNCECRVCKDHSR